MRYLTGGTPTPREEIRDQIIPFHLAIYERLDRLGTWAAESTGTGEFLGWFHFRPGPDADLSNIELGYRLRRPAWNKGYATEGSRALIRMGFTELAVERVFAHTMTVNAGIAARPGEMRPDAGAHHSLRGTLRNRRRRARRGRVRDHQARMAGVKATGRKARSWYFDGQEDPRTEIVGRWLTTLLWFSVVAGRPDKRGRSVSSRVWPRLVSI